MNAIGAARELASLKATGEEVCTVCCKDLHPLSVWHFDKVFLEALLLIIVVDRSPVAGGWFYGVD